jgi:hypothetical protein
MELVELCQGAHPDMECFRLEFGVDSEAKAGVAM